MSLDGLIDTAQAMYAAGNFDGAERVTRQVLDDDPNDRDGLLMLSQIFDHRKDYAEAVELQRRVIQRDPHDEDARGFYIMSLVRLDQRAAREALDAFKKDFPGSAHIRVLEAILSMAKVDLSKLKADADRLREERGDCLELNLMDTTLALGEHRYADAYRAAKSALEKDPLDATTHNMAASAAFWSGRPRLARRHAQEALKYEPSSTEMRGLIRLSHALWFPPMALTYGLVMVMTYLNEKVSFFVALLLAIVTIKFGVNPILASLAAKGFPAQEIMYLIYVCFAYLFLELFVVPKFEERQGKRELVLKDY